VVCCIQCCVLKVFHNYITDHWRKSVPLPYCFCWQSLPSNWKYIVVKQMSSSSLMSSLWKGEHSKKGPKWVYFLWPRLLPQVR
jgi:hypothetical protein